MNPNPNPNPNPNLNPRWMDGERGGPTRFLAAVATAARGKKQPSHACHCAREPRQRAPSHDRSTAARSPTGERALRRGNPRRRRPSSPASAALRADKGERDLGFREERVWERKEHHRGAARRRREWLRPHACTGEGRHGDAITLLSGHRVSGEKGKSKPTAAAKREPKQCCGRRRFALQCYGHHQFPYQANTVKPPTCLWASTIW